MLEGLVHRVIAQLFALSGQLGLGVFMRESVLVRLGVIRRRFVFMRFSGEDDDGIRGDVVQTCSYQRRAHVGAIAVLERVRELGRSGSADGCVCIFGMPSTELGVTSARAGWGRGSVVALTCEGSSGAA